jgi:hypothetical protein
MKTTREMIDEMVAGLELQLEASDEPKLAVFTNIEAIHLLRILKNIDDRLNQHDLEIQGTYVAAQKAAVAFSDLAPDLIFYHGRCYVAPEDWENGLFYKHLKELEL